MPKWHSCKRSSTWRRSLFGITTRVPYSKQPWQTLSESAMLRKFSAGSSQSFFSGQPSLVNRMTFVKVGSREDSFRNVPESVGSTCKLSVSMVQTVSTSSVLSSVENGIFTYWQSTEDSSIGVFRSLAVLDGVVEFSKK